MRYDWARRHWPMTLVVFGLFVALGMVALLVPSARSEFIAGAFFASAGWAVAYFMEMMSGAAPAAMGEMAESWTATELCRLRRSGWRVAHSVRLDRRGDIDHVAIGPGGLVVVETKWRGNGWHDAFAEERVRGAVDQVARNARLVRLTLPRVSPVTPVVVLWGYPEPPEAIRQVDGVVVVHGSDFARWLGQANRASSVDGGGRPRPPNSVRDAARGAVLVGSSLECRPGLTSGLGPLAGERRSGVCWRPSEPVLPAPSAAKGASEVVPTRLFGLAVVGTPSAHLLVLAWRRALHCLSESSLRLVQ